MGLERASSGLKVRDEFGSDTSANYDLEGANTLDISEGHATPSGYGICAHKSSSGTLCVTADMGQRYVCLMPAQTVSDYTHRDGYWLHNDGGTMRLMKFVDEASTALATASASGAMRLRIYVYDGVVYAKAGKVVDGTLPYGCSASNTDWTAPFQGAVYETPGQYFDNFDCRTSHLITCSGMTEGHYLRVSDGTTAAEAQESSGTATADAGAVLFPLASVQIRTAAAGGGDLIAELDTGDYADMGGGDAFEYSGAAAGNPYWYYQMLARRR